MRYLRKKLLIIALLISATLPLAFIDNYFEVSKNLDVFATMFKELNSYYVDDVEPASLMRTGIDAILESLDPYTNFISEAEIEDYRFQTTGKYGGIGALIRKRDKYVIISEPYEGYPAFKAGLMAGDIIIEIDGKSAAEKNTDDISKALKGSPDTEVKVLIRRPGVEGDFLRTLVREEIKIESVPYFGMIKDNIGYVRFTSFRERSGKDVSIAVEDLMKQNKDLKGIVLDIRGNGGGLLMEAVNTSNIFIDKGKPIVSTKGKIKESEKVYKSLNSVVAPDLPLVILTDRSSASASEIVAGAVQDYDRGVIVGQRTFGKGLVQTTRPLTYNNQLKITTAKYYIPSGRCIQAIDYSHKNGNGGSDKIPDSLKTAFKTEAGRVVYDGGGIEPDVEVNPPKLSNISQSLMFTHNLIFDYATKFRSENETISVARDFKITDEIFSDFVSFISDKDYSYDTKTEASIKKLEKIAEAEKYHEAIKEEIEHIRGKLNEDKGKDIEKNKEEIMELLEDEIVGRYYYRKGRIEAMFDSDPYILKALDLLSNQEEYKRLLEG